MTDETEQLKAELAARDATIARLTKALCMFGAYTGESSPPCFCPDDWFGNAGDEHSEACDAANAALAEGQPHASGENRRRNTYNMAEPSMGGSYDGELHEHAAGES